MWAETQPRTVLSGLKLPNGEIVTSDDAMCEELAQHWRQTFLSQPSDATAARELVNEVLGMADIPPPTKALSSHFLVPCPFYVLDGLKCQVKWPPNSNLVLLRRMHCAHPPVRRLPCGCLIQPSPEARPSSRWSLAATPPSVL